MLCARYLYRKQIRMFLGIFEHFLALIQWAQQKLLCG